MTAPAPTRRRGLLEPDSLALTGVALVAAAAAGAALAGIGVRLLDAPAPRDALAAAPATAIDLLAHNARVALWPLALLALGWTGVRAGRRAGDVLIAGQLLGHGALIGAALAQQPALWRYLPHLPVEWLAIALPAAAWLSARTRSGRPGLRGLLVLAVIVTALLAMAATVETYLVPL